MMRKTFFYSFVPTKAEEEAGYEVGRSLIEIRDWNQNGFDMTNPNQWQIRRVITKNEVVSGEITLSEEEMLQYVLKSWKLDSAKHVIRGNKCLVVLVDYTEDRTPKSFQNCYVKVSGNAYHVGLMDVFLTTSVKPGDEVALFGI